MNTLPEMKLCKLQFQKCLQKAADFSHLALEQKSEFIFALDAEVHLEPKALDHLIQRSKAYEL